MKWIWRYVWNRMREIGNEPKPEMTTAGRRLSTSWEPDGGLNLQIYNAIGGRIVSFRHYDQKTDRSFNKVYIIHDDLDFHSELSKIITQESMR